MLLAVGLGEGQETSIHLLIWLCQKLRNMAAVILIPVNPGTTSLQPQKKKQKQKQTNKKQQQKEQQKSVKSTYALCLGFPRACLSGSVSQQGPNHPS